MQRRSFGPRLAAVLLSGLVLSPLALAAQTAPTPTAPLLPVTVTLAANNVTVPQGTAIILTATVTPTSAPPATGEQNPTGTIVFLNGTVVIGQSALAALPVANASTATLTIQKPSRRPGLHHRLLRGRHRFRFRHLRLRSRSAFRDSLSRRRRPIRPLTSISSSANPVRSLSSLPTPADSPARCRSSARLPCKTT